MLVLDADKAGLKASASAAQAALRAGLRVKAVRLPLGEDPADLITRDAKDFTERVKAAKPAVDFFLFALAERERDAGRLLRHVEVVVLPLVAVMGSPMERERALQAIGRALGLSTESVRESFLKVRLSNTPGKSDFQGIQAGNTPAKPISAREARAALLSGAVHAYPELPLANRIKIEYARITGDQVLPAEAPVEPFIFEAERQFGEAPGEQAADDLLRAFEEAVIREAYQEAIASLRKAESAGDPVMVEEAGARCAALSSQLAKLGY